MESDTLWILLGAGGIFLFGVIAYVLFMVFLPEWVGITGKVSLEAEKAHRQGEAKESAFWTKMGQEPVQPSETAALPPGETPKD